jgi:hypothetical protein
MRDKINQGIADNDLSLIESCSVWIKTTGSNPMISKMKAMNPDKQFASNIQVVLYKGSRPKGERIWTLDDIKSGHVSNIKALDVKNIFTPFTSTA